MANMLGRYGSRQADRRAWLRDAWESDAAQELVEIQRWYENIEAISDPYYELPPGFDGAWRTASPE